MSPRANDGHVCVLLGAKTEFWRAHRKFAGIIPFVYLTCSYPGVYTADHFADVRRLRLDPAFADYMGEAFKPLGVYVNFFQPSLPAGTNRTFTVMMVNDDAAPVSGTLALTLETARGVLWRRPRRRSNWRGRATGRWRSRCRSPRGPGLTC
jgi:hypothetical protein